MDTSQEWSPPAAYRLTFRSTEKGLQAAAKPVACATHGPPCAPPRAPAAACLPTQDRQLNRASCGGQIRRGNAIRRSVCRHELEQLRFRAIPRGSGPRP